MKIVFLHRIISALLAFLMFATSIGFTIDMHYCNSEFKSFSFFGKAESCHTLKKTCPHHANMVVSQKSVKDCCSNESFQLDDIDLDFDVSPLMELNDQQGKFVASFVFSFFSMTPPRVLQSSAFFETVDPLPPRDICVLFERFLI